MAGFLDKDTGLPYFWSKLKTLFGGKADKVTGATNGNFAGLDANGNLTDSGKKTSDFKAASAHDSWSEVTGKPFENIGTGLSVSNDDLVNAGVRAAYLSTAQSASGSGYKAQALSVNMAGVSNDDIIQGTRYTEIVGATATTTYTFTRTEFKSSSLVIRDICTNYWGDYPTSVSVDATNGTLTITFASSATRTVRVYFDT